MAASAGQADLLGLHRGELDHLFGHLLRDGRPSRRADAGGRGGVALPDVGHPTRQPRLLLPSGQPGHIIVRAFLPSDLGCSSAVGSHFGRHRRGDAGWDTGWPSRRRQPWVRTASTPYGQIYSWSRGSYALRHPGPRLRRMVLPPCRRDRGDPGIRTGRDGLGGLWRGVGRPRPGDVGDSAGITSIPRTWSPWGSSWWPLPAAQRGHWVWAGVLLGLAVTSQQFALLVLAPLFVVAPGRQRWRLLVSAGVAGAVIFLPVLVATSGRAIHTEILGTGDSATLGGTVLWELRLHGAALVFFSRMLPILVAVGLAWWALRRLGPGIMQPVPFLSLVATSLSMRLVFEQGLFPYKFMALGVMLVLLAVARGRVRGQRSSGSPSWGLPSTPFRSGTRSTRAHGAITWRPRLPLVFLVVVLGFIVWDATQRRVRWYLVASFALAAWAFLQWPLWSPDTLRAPIPEVVLAGRSPRHRSRHGSRTPGA